MHGFFISRAIYFEFVNRTEVGGRAQASQQPLHPLYARGAQTPRGRRSTVNNFFIAFSACAGLLQRGVR